MKNLKIYSSSERRPKNREAIWLFSASAYCGLESQSIEFTNIEYCWFEICPETGNWDGTTYSYDGMKNKPNKNCRLGLLDNDGVELLEGFLYAKESDIDKLFD